MIELLLSATNLDTKVIGSGGGDILLHFIIVLMKKWK